MRGVPERLARLRAASQRMHRPGRGGDPVDVARRLAGAQAQEKRAGLLQLRARSRGLTADAVERARVEERSLVRGWLMRGTVHLVASDDYGWMLPLWSERHAANARRRLGQLGMPAATQERAVAVMERALGNEGALSRPELVDRLARAGVELSPEMRIHLMFLIVVERRACIGPDRGGSGSLVLADEWLGAGARPREREASLGELARRYLGAFAPATERDFSAWAGLPLRDCRAGLARIASELAEHSAGATSTSMGRTTRPAGPDPPLLPLRASRPRVQRSPLVRLLGAFDTYLMGYASRRHAVDEARERRILPGGGVLRPTICVDGRFAGLWASKRSGRKLAVTLEPFSPLGDDVIAAIETEVEDLGRFEGSTAVLATR